MSISKLTNLQIDSKTRNTQAVQRIKQKERAMGTDAVLLSVIIPAYNVIDYLQECIDSICPSNKSPEKNPDELEKRIEIILVDDGSTDGTAELCDKNAERDTRIRVIHQKNSGVAAARNTGIKNANGDWLLFVDADDWIDLAVIKELLSRSGMDLYDMLAFSIKMERPDGAVKESSNTGEWHEYDANEYRELFQTLCLQNQMYWPDVEKNSHRYPIMTICVNKLFKKSLLTKNNLYMRENIAQYEDRIFNYECVNKLEKVLFYDKVAYFYRYRPSSAIHSDGVKMIKQMRDTIECFYSVIGAENKNIINGPFAYSRAQMLWTIVDRLGKSSPSAKELGNRSKCLKEFMEEPLIRDTFKNISIAKVHSNKHRIVCRFLKHGMPLPPIWLCYMYHKIRG